MEITLIKDLKKKHGGVYKSGSKMRVTPSKYQELKKSGHIESDEKPAIKKEDKADFKTNKDK